LVHNIAYVGAPLDREVKGVEQLPVLKIVYQDLSGLSEIEGVLVFTSKRGIISLRMSNVSIRSNRIYCIGEQTAHYLKKIFSLDCKVPQEQNTEGLAALMIGTEKSVTIVGSDNISRKFIDKIKENGIKVKHIIAYKIEENTSVDYGILDRTGVLLVGSSKSFELLHRRLGEKLKGKSIYAIGKPTAKKIRFFGYEPKEVFDTPNIETIVTILATKR
jgi:uroporphyrinogen-III synthase